MQTFKIQITADESKISKTLRCELSFFLNVPSEYSIHFFLFLLVLAKKNAVSFMWSSFYRKRDCVTMRNYAGTC